MNIRLPLINLLNSFAANNSPADGYDWGELYNDDYIISELSEEKLIELTIHYLNYIKGE